MIRFGNKKLGNQENRKDTSRSEAWVKADSWHINKNPSDQWKVVNWNIFFKHSICEVTPENWRYLMALWSWLLFWNAKCFISIAWVCLCKKLLSCNSYQHNDSLFRKFVIQSRQYYGPCVLLCFVFLLFWIVLICCWLGFEKRQTVQKL